MSTAIQNAKHSLRRELSLLGYTDDQMAALSSTIATFTKRVVVAELAMRDAAQKAIAANDPMARFVNGSWRSR